MVKYLVVILCIFSISCNKSNTANTICFKGKLALKGICMNYVIQIIEGDIDKSLYENSWQNPNTGITYENVFGLASICTFPSNINEGEEFYFSIPKNPIAQNCTKCEAFSPTPNKRISIEICK